MTIPVLKPSCTDAEVAAVTEVLRSGWWGQGPVCEAFEDRLAKRYGYKHAVTVNSCTAALHLALKAANVGPGDEVIVPALTFVSTALAVTYCGATPVFADVDPGSLCMCPRDAKSKTTERTKVILPVDYAGYPAYHKWYSTEWLTVVQDAAHSCGSVGYGDFVCLSFHPVKNLASPDGGAILTNDEAAAARMKALRWVGIDKSTWERSEKWYGWDYDINEVGWKCHWNDVAAAIAMVQLDRLDELNAARRRIACRYLDAFGDLSDRITLPATHKDHTWHLFAIRVDGEVRNALVDHLVRNHISAGVHYQPLTHYPMYRDQETPPVTEQEWQRLVSLPIYPDLTDKEQDKVIQCVRGFLR